MNRVAAGVHAAVVTSLVFLLAAGCGRDAPDPSGDTFVEPPAAVDPAEIRAELDGMHFISEGMFVQGSVTTAFPGEIAMGHYSLSFTHEEVMWQYDDLCPTSPYQVDAEGHIKSTDYFGNPIEGKYDRGSGRLEWDGVWYVAE
jgi:hypothetical protein